MSDKERARLRLGELAHALASASAPKGESVNSAHLETGIAQLQAQSTALEEQVTSLAAELEKARKASVTRTLIERETDQLYTEFSALVTMQHTELVNLTNGIRYMLNIFAEDMAGADVEELIKSTNAWLDRTVKPIDDSLKEAAKTGPADSRQDNENAPDRVGEIVNSQVQQSGPETRVEQEELPFQEKQKETPEVER